MYKIENYAESVVKLLLEDLLKKYPNICKCEKCKADMLALSLNNIPPKYSVSEEGKAYTKALTEVNIQGNIDMITIVTRAIELVSSNPKH